MTPESRPEWVAEIIAGLDRIEDALRSTRSLQTPFGTMTRDELMAFLKCNSDSALDRLTTSLGIRSYSPGRYRFGDVTNAIMRASNRAYQRELRARRASAAEQLSGRRLVAE